MSVLVENVTKIYGQQKAVDDLSFEVHPGEILGFLGPNGAGKTTTMKIITSFLPASEGKVTVAGHDVVEHPMEVRQQIGYLPEHNPLYLDMYVREYLTFVAKLHKIQNPTQAIDRMVQLTGLEKEQKKHIRSLSKGYRQRVGLAQAMIHDPKVLILDEPTAGLDPNQLVEIRSLIKQIGKDKTVIFSTHIMQEVEALCDRVLIINQGKSVAYGNLDSIGSLNARTQITTVGFAEAVPKEQLLAIPHVTKVVSRNTKLWDLHSDAKHDIRSEVFKQAVAKGWVLIEMHKQETSVENVFQELTQK